MESRLLDWATKNTDPDAVPDLQVTERMRKLDPELVEMILGRDEVVVMRELVGKLDDNLDTSREALEHLEEILEKIDSAVTFGRAGMWDGIFKVLKKQDLNLDAALSLLGTASQNNPPVQTQLVDEYDVLQVFVDLFARLEASGLPRSAGKIKSKLVYAVSAVVKNQQDIFQKFINMGGMACVMSLREDPDVCNRVEHLLSFLQSEYPEIKF